jgi:predicted RNA-binding Zn ribbon-like protein
MGCNSSYMEPTMHEANTVEVCKHIVWVDKKLGLKTDPAVVKASTSAYGDDLDLDGLTASLCSKIKKMTPEERETVVYNAHSANSRALAGWWDTHRAADRERKKTETAEKKKAALVRSALSKLTEAEKKALDL